MTSQQPGSTMPDTLDTPERLTRIQDFVMPRYDGGSILNIPDTLCELFKIPLIAGHPITNLPSRLYDKQYENIVLILMDSLALHRLKRWMEDGTAPVWRDLSTDGSLTPLTSITPSTTSAALTTLWTGRSPFEHGITGYEMWLKEFGVVANSILHAPITFANSVGSLERAGFDPVTFLNLPRLGSHLTSHEIATHAFQHSSIAHSGLSRMLLQDVNVNVFNSTSDLMVNLRRHLELNSGQRLYTWVYWGMLDHLGHHFGPDDERAVAEFTDFSRAFERYFVDKLPQSARDKTLLILTADHGQIFTPILPEYNLNNHPDFDEMLHIKPTGENRLVNLYVKPTKLNQVSDYIREQWREKFNLYETEKLVDMGLFGTGQKHPGLMDRLGDLIMVAKDESYLWWSDKRDHLVGRHGGLHTQEMRVPFLALEM